MDRGKPLWEGAFFFARIALSPPLDKRNTHDKAKGLRNGLKSFIHKEAPELTTQAHPLKSLGYLNICLNFAVSYEYTRGHYAGEAHQSGPRVVREAGVNPAQYPLL